MLTDELREFVNEKYFVPARSENKLEVIIKAGTVHDQMRFENRVPAVCNALRSKELRNRYNVQLTDIKYGSNVTQKNAKNSMVHIQTIVSVFAIHVWQRHCLHRL